MLIFVVSVLYLFVAVVMFSSCAFMLIYFQEILISLLLESLEFSYLSCLESFPVALSCVS